MNTVSDTLSTTFAALSDPTRRAMLVRLAQGEASVSELAAPFRMSLPAVSKHIKKLEKAGLLTKTRHAQQRPCRIDGEQLRQAVDWIEQYRQLWEGRRDQLDVSLHELHVAESAATPDASKPIDPRVKTNRSAADKRAKRSAGNGAPAKENTDDHALQQQIGFDF